MKYFTRDRWGDGTFTPFGRGGEHFSPREVADAVEAEPFAVLTRDGDVKAGADRGKLARYGTPHTGAEVAGWLRGRT